MAKPSDSGEPLPRPNSFNTGTELVLHAAYSRCLDFETNVLANPAALPHACKLSPLICARLLGRLLLEAPTDDGCAIVATETVRCQGDTNLQKIANLYKDHFIRCWESKLPLFNIHAGAYAGSRLSRSLPNKRSHSGTFVSSIRTIV